MSDQLTAVGGSKGDQFGQEEGPEFRILGQKLIRKQTYLQKLNSRKEIIRNSCMPKIYYLAYTHLATVDDEVEGAVDDNEEVGDCHHDVHLGSPDCGGA